MNNKECINILNNIKNNYKKEVECYLKHGYRIYREELYIIALDHAIKNIKKRGKNEIFRIF